MDHLDLQSYFRAYDRIKIESKIALQNKEFRVSET
jgi:hypothetical protein